jgi:hypothetical protein
MVARSSTVPPGATRDEEFLKTIEPKYNASVEKLRSGKIDKEAVYVIVGYVATCSPAGSSDAT